MPQPDWPDSPGASAALPDDLESEAVPTGDLAGSTGPLGRIAFALGSVGLLAATAADALAVAGRHSGFHLLGSIELVQTAVVVLASAAMLAVTLGGRHAAVHIVTDRLAAPAAARLRRLASAISALVFLMLAAGSAWVAIDLWTGYEQTELLQIPLRWLRLLWIAFALLIALVFARSALRRAP